MVRYAVNPITAYLLFDWLAFLAVEDEVVVRGPLCVDLDALAVEPSGARFAKHPSDVLAGRLQALGRVDVATGRRFCAFPARHAPTHMSLTPS